MRWMVIYEYEIPGSALKDHGYRRNLPLQGIIPMIKLRIETGAS
jgi:hypothetical protein